MPPEREEEVPPQALSPREEAGREYRAAGEQARLYPMEGEMYIDLLSITEIGEGGDITEMEQVVLEALAFREGLTYGSSNYDLDNPGVLMKFYNDFTTVEEATSRPSSYYLDPALREALGGRVREVKLRNTSRGLWEKWMRRKYRNLPAQNIEEGVRAESLRVQRIEAAEAKLIALENVIDARRVFDQAFNQRMESCENPQHAADLGDKDRRYQLPVTPDKGHWKALFSGEWGKSVNDNFWEVVKLGLPDRVIARLGLTSIPREVRGKVKADIYSEGFESTDVFKRWLKLLYGQAGERMDIAWAAWRLALATEVISELGVSIPTVGKNRGKVKLIPPPLGNSLHTYTAHLTEKTALELGYRVQKDRGRIIVLPGRIQLAKYISHSGLPMATGELPNLCRSFWHQSTIELSIAELRGKYASVLNNLLRYLPSETDEDYDLSLADLKEDLDTKLGKVDGRISFGPDEERDPEKIKVEISLWELGLYGKLAFSDETFPWFQTEEVRPGVSPGEMATGTFGFWLLTRSRSNGIKEYILATPSARDLGDATFFIKPLRNMEKVWGPLKEDTPPEKNPRAWLLMGYLRFHIGGRTDKAPITNEYPLKDYRNLNRSEELLDRGPSADAKGVTIGDVFANAKECGWIRQVDEDWIKKHLNIKLL